MAARFLAPSSDLVNNQFLRPRASLRNRFSTRLLLSSTLPSLRNTVKAFHRFNMYAMAFPIRLFGGTSRTALSSHSFISSISGFDFSSRNCRRFSGDRLFSRANASMAKRSLYLSSIQHARCSLLPRASLNPLRACPWQFAV